MRVVWADFWFAVAIVTFAGAGSAQSQMDLNRQAAEQYRTADQKLNTVYSSLAAKLSPAGKASLQTAQLTWIRFRDQECDFEAMGTIGGSIHPMIVSGCLARLTIQRTKDLELQLNCQEGDLSCVRQ